MDCVTAGLVDDSRRRCRLHSLPFQTLHAKQAVGQRLDSRQLAAAGSGRAAFAGRLAALGRCVPVPSRLSQRLDSKPSFGQQERNGSGAECRAASWHGVATQDSVERGVGAALRPERLLVFPCEQTLRDTTDPMPMPCVPSRGSLWSGPADPQPTPTGLQGAATYAPLSYFPRLKPPAFCAGRGPPTTRARARAQSRPDAPRRNRSAARTSSAAATESRQRDEPDRVVPSDGGRALQSHVDRGSPYPAGPTALNCAGGELPKVLGTRAEDTELE